MTKRMTTLYGFVGGFVLGIFLLVLKAMPTFIGESVQALWETMYRPGEERGPGGIVLLIVLAILVPMIFFALLGGAVGFGFGLLTGTGKKKRTDDSL